MMQTTWKKRVAAWLMAAAMTFGLTGCGKGGSSSAGGEANSAPAVSAAGSWREADVTPSQDAHSFGKPVLLEDDSLLLLEKKSDDTISLWSSDDNGTTWQETPTGWREETGASYFGVTSVFPDGGCFVAAIYDGGASRSWKYWAADAGGASLRELTLPESIQTVTDVQPVTGQTALLMGMMRTPATADAPPALLNEDGTMNVMSTWKLDLSTGSCTEVADLAQMFGGSTVSGLAPDPTEAGAFYYISYQASGANLVRCTLDGAANTVFENLPDASLAAFAACSDGDGNFYYASDKGIYRVAKGGDLAELVVDASGTAMQRTNFAPQGLACCADGSFLLSAAEDTPAANGSEDEYLVTPHIYRYYWDASAAAPETDANLTVWSLENNDTVRAAITEFEAQNLGQKVNYQIGTDGGAGREDALSSLNTALLAGSGPDVLILDGMDWEAYRDKGLLADLTGYVDTSALRENLVAPFLDESGAACVLPARFSVPVLCGESDTLSGATTLPALADTLLQFSARPAYDCQSAEYYETLDEPYGLGFISVGQLLDFALASSASELAKNGVDGSAVSAVLEFVSGVGGYYGMDAYGDFVSNGVVTGGSGEATAYSDGGYECFFTHNAAMAWDDMLSPAYVADVLKEEPSFSVVCRPGLADGAFTHRTLAGISASSGAREEAGEFLAVLFGDAVQSSWQQDGMPVRADALEQSLTRNCSGEALDMAKKLIDSLKTPVTMPDDTVYSALLLSANALIEGNTTLEQAKTGVEDALKLYLAEQE